jgi:hypothetical protein
MALRILAFLLLAFALEWAFFPVAPPTGFAANDVSGLRPDNHSAIGQATADQIQAACKAHAHDFDYLLGDWEFTAVNRDGKFHGLWSAVRLADTGQILDEFRIINDNGDTVYVSTTLRAYNGILDQWELVSVDKRGTGLTQIGTGHRVGGEMHIEQKFGFGTSTAWISRIRYFNIRPDDFSWNADRSLDNGKTWIKDFQQIEAHRIGPPRPFGPLAPARKSTGT